MNAHACEAAISSVLPAIANTERPDRNRPKEGSLSPRKGEASLVEMSVHEETIKAMRREIVRLMVRIDEEILIQAELRDQVLARNAEIERLRSHRWWRFWTRRDRDDEDRGEVDEDVGIGEASLANMGRL